MSSSNQGNKNPVAWVVITTTIITAVGGVLAALFAPPVLVQINQEGRATAIAELQPTINKLDDTVQTPQIIEQTQIVTVTQLVEVTREVPITQVVVTTPTPPPNPTPEPISIPINLEQKSVSKQDVTVYLDRIEVLPNGKSRLYLEFRNKSGNDYCIKLGTEDTYISNNSLDKYEVTHHNVETHWIQPRTKTPEYFLEMDNITEEDETEFTLTLTMHTITGWCYPRFDPIQLYLNY